MAFRPVHYSCEETCGMKRACGNIHCSANPKYTPPKKKTGREKKTERSN